MTMSIRTNVGSLNAQRNLYSTQNTLNTSLAKLSSGYRITKAGDDAAGLAISEVLRSQISGLNQASRNAQDGISFIQTAEGALQEVHSMLQRMNTLALQASNATLSNENRGLIAKEVGDLRAEITSIADRVNFNGVKMLGEDKTIEFQIGTGKDDKLGVDFKSIKMDEFASDLDDAIQDLLDAAADFDPTDPDSGATADDASALIDGIKAAINSVSDMRATLGAAQNRLDHAIENINVTAENLSASESRIRDADVAAETAEMTKAQILMQAGVSVLAQANQMPQMALKLLG
ncbi:flagellin [Vulgatibacter incomptus]|uniref:Flagellin n=1 Tax=Vulgatibacter incomptus TaxID=1391653 RepID=A0A0K1PHH6_9BACT|nr:flagellin [Vulgatibacter incomptus]AKU92993.1 Flagellin protein FlaA [Vulgatibacter incomptus]